MNRQAGRQGSLERAGNENGCRREHPGRHVTSAAVCPPEYFPRVSWCALMLAVDRLVVADTFQYSRQSFQNRARLRTPDGWQWISIPLKGRQHGRPIHQVVLESRTDWTASHRRALAFNYGSSPFYAFYEDQLDPLYTDPPTHLGRFTNASIVLLHRLLGLTTELVFTSDLPGAPGTLQAVRDQLGLNRLLSLPKAAPYNAQVIEAVDVLTFRETPYYQNFDGFEPNMSGLDLLFNYGPESISILRERTVIRSTY